MRDSITSYDLYDEAVSAGMWRMDDISMTGEYPACPTIYECNSDNNELFFNNIRCACQVAYHVECTTDGAPQAPCDAPLTPGLSEMDTLCTCVDPTALSPYYPDWASPDLIDRA